MADTPDLEAVDQSADIPALLGSALSTFSQAGNTELEEEPGNTAADSGAGGGIESAEVLPPASDAPVAPAQLDAPSVEGQPNGALPPATPENARLQSITGSLNVTPEMVTAFKAENPMFAQMDDVEATQALKDILGSVILESQDLDEARRAAGEAPAPSPAAPSLWSDFKGALRGRASQGGNPLIGGVLSGVAKSGFETYDAVNELALGNESDPSEWRQGIERYYDSTSGLSGAAAVIAQWGVAFVGVGKFAKLAKIPGLATTAATRTGQVLQASAKGAAADFLAFDGMQNRLSNIVQEYPALENPVTGYLAASPEDTQAEGRLKNALEGLGIGATVDVVLAGFRAMKAYRGGNKEAADAAIDDAAAAYDAVAKEPEVAQVVPDGVPVAEGAQPGRVPSDVPNPAATPRAADESLEAQTRTVEGPGTPGIQPSLPREELQLAAKEMAQRVLDDPLPPVITPEAKQPIPSTFDSITQADELKAVIDATEKEILKGIDGSNSAKGRISIEETQRIAQQLAADTGQDPGSFFLRMQKDSDNIESLSARILAYDQTTRVLAVEVRDMAMSVRSGNPGQFGTMEALKDAFESRLAAYAQVQDWLKGVRSETGRALAIMRHSQSLGQSIDVSNIAAFGQGLGTAGRNVTVEELAEAVIMAGTDRKLLGRIANPTKYAQVRDAMVSLFIKNILSGWETHVVNILGNVSAAISHPAAKIIGGALHRDTLTMREGIKQYGFMVSESLHALRMAGEAYKRGYNILDPSRSKFHADGLFPEALTASKISGGMVPDESVTGYLANGAFKVIDAVSTRALSASDEFFKQNLYASELTARAWADGVAQGLKGPELKAYIKQQRDAGFTTAPDVGANTANVAGNANAEAAFNVARFNTFTQNVKPGGIASSVLYITNKHPELKFAVPFVRVISNLLEFTGSMTPGVANLMTSYKEAIGRGGRDAAVARGRLAIGFSAWTTAMGLAASGQITGAGPTKQDGSPDFKRRQLLEQTGWKPNSLKIGDTYYNLSRLDPYGLIFNIAATAHDKFQAGMRDEKSWIDIAATMSFSLAHTLGERQYLKGLADLMEALNDDTGRTFNSYVANLGASLVVPNAIRQGITIQADPVLREARGFVEQIMKRTPYASENLAARRMPWGAKMELKPQNLYSSDDLDPLMREYARLLESGHSGGGEPLPRMRPVPGGKSLDMAAMILPNGESLYDAYGDLIEQPDPSVPKLTDTLRDLIESDAYKNEMIDGPGALKGTRLKAWQTIMSRYRSAAWRKVLEQYPEVRERVYGKKQSVAEQAEAQKRAVEIEAFLDE